MFQSQGESGRCRSRRILWCAILVIAAPSGGTIHAQPSESEAANKSATSAEQVDDPKSTAQRLKDIRSQLAEINSLVEETKKEGQQPSASLSQQVELLTRLEMTLSQIAAAESDLAEAKKTLEQNQSALDGFLLQGFSSEQSRSFLLLDTTREELESEKRRQVRTAAREEAALEVFDKARQELNDAQSKRRIAKERLETNSDDSQNILLTQQLAEAELLSQLAQATVDLRKLEFDQAEAMSKAGRLLIRLKEEQLAILSANAEFDQNQLNEKLQELDQREAELKESGSERAANDTKRKYFEEQWMRAQRQLDQSPSDKKVLEQELLAHQLGRRSLDEQEAVLQLELARLKERRQTWIRRQQLFSGRPSVATLREWTNENRRQIAQLVTDERNVATKLEDLRGQLTELENRVKEISEETPERYWLSHQAASLRTIVQAQEGNLRSIQTALRLQYKLAQELEGDSLVHTARRRLGDLQDSLYSIWNYEIASFNENPLTIQKVVKALVILFIGFVSAGMLSRWLRQFVLQRLDIDTSAAATIESLFYYLLIVLFSLSALKFVQVPLTAFTVLGGAVALGVGFGSQNIINNFISGLILHAERPVKVGDLIRLQDSLGNVEHIGARSTRLRTGENLEIIVPNSTFLQQNVVNYTLSSDKVRTSVSVGVAYGSPTIKVTQILKRAVVATGRASKEPPPLVLFKDFGDSALEFEVHFWIRMRTTMERLQIESAVRYQIVQMFEEEGIVIAFPQTDVHLDTSAPLVVQMQSVPNAVNSLPAPRS